MAIKILWPERESLYDLMCLRAQVGAAAFESEKQNNPIDPAACEWPDAYFSYPGFWFDTWPTDGLVIRTLALDPSKGRDAKHGDYSAYVRLGRDKRGISYVEADLQRRTPEQIVADGVEHCRQFRPDGFAVEVNQFQELLRPMFLAVGERERVHLPLHGIENTTNKMVRIRRLGPLLSQHKWRFKAKSPGTTLLVQQLRDFPNGEHDDGPDSLEMALRLAIILWDERGR